MVKVEGKIAMQSISILANPGSTHSYIAMRISKGCGLKRKKHEKP